METNNMYPIEARDNPWGTYFSYYLWWSFIKDTKFEWEDTRCFFGINTIETIGTDYGTLSTIF